jgi:thymidylate synthase ThyX
MLTKTISRDGRQPTTKLILTHDVSPENMTMVQALIARSPVSVETRINEIHAAELVEAIGQLRGTDVWVELSESCVQVHLDEETCSELAAKVLAIGRGHDACAKARRLGEQYLVGYGHKSIGDTGSFTLVAEGVSMLAAKAIEQSPLFNGQELSTRAVDMTAQPVLDPEESPETRAIQDAWIEFYARARQPVAAEVRRRHPRQPGEGEKQYEDAVAYRTFDVTRAFLPAGSTTNVSMHTTIRHANDHLAFLMNHPLREVRQVGRGWSELAREAYPSSGSFGEEATVSGVGRDGRAAERAAWTQELWASYAYEPSSVFSPESPIDWSFWSSLNLGPQLFGPAICWRDRTDLWDRRPRGVRLPHELARLGSLHWSFLLDFGSFRDLQRQRYAVLPMPLLTLAHGFEPWYLNELPTDLALEASRFLAAQEQRIRALIPDPVVRQYYLAMGYRVGCYIALNLPAFVYVAELRSSKTVHPTLRRVIHRMAHDFKRAHPEVKLHVDWDEDDWTVRRGGQTITRADPK